MERAPPSHAFNRKPGRVVCAQAIAARDCEQAFRSKAFVDHVRGRRLRQDAFLEVVNQRCDAGLRESVQRLCPRPRSLDFGFDKRLAGRSPICASTLRGCCSGGHRAKPAHGSMESSRGFAIDAHRSPAHSCCAPKGVPSPRCHLSGVVKHELVQRTETARGSCSFPRSRHRRALPSSGCRGSQKRNPVHRRKNPQRWHRLPRSRVAHLQRRRLERMAKSTPKKLNSATRPIG